MIKSTNQGIRTIIYPVKDIAQAKTLYSGLLGVEPYSDQAYVDFRPSPAPRLSTLGMVSP